MVVGYAGLLDLGYVAFYAVGAYTAGWFASQQFSQRSIQHRRRRAPERAARDPHLDVARAPPGGPADAVLRHRDRPADAAPARRLPGDRDARLRRDRARSSCATPTTWAASTSPHGTFGITPIDSIGLRRHRRQARPPRELPPVLGPGPVVLLGRGRDPADHGLLQRSAARVAARPRLDRDPRGRDGRRRDGHPADADEDVGLRPRRLLRRRRRRLLRELQGRRLPGGLLLQHLGLPALHGHPRRDGQRLGRPARRHDPRLPRTSRASPRSAPRSSRPGSTSTRRSTSSGSTGSSSC